MVQASEGVGAMAAMNPDYVVWLNANQTEYSAVLNSIEGLEPKQLLSIQRGLPWEGRFPPVGFRFHPDFPDNTILSDSLMNQNQMIVVSEQLRDFIVGEKIPAVEFLPVNVRDHKGKPTAPYFIAHLLQPIDCLDREASGAVVRPTAKDQIMAVKRVVLRPDAIPQDRTFFAVAGFLRIKMVRRDLADSIERQFPGIKFRDPSKVR